MGGQHLGQYRVHVRALRRLRRHFPEHAQVRDQLLLRGWYVSGLFRPLRDHHQGGVRHGGKRTRLLRRQCYRRVGSFVLARVGTPCVRWRVHTNTQETKAGTMGWLQARFRTDIAPCAKRRQRSLG